MKKFLNRLFENHEFIFKTAIYLISVVAIVYLFPRGGQFKYQFQKGKVWQYEDYYAPFDFAITKSEDILNAEIENIEKNKHFFFKRDDSLVNFIESKLGKEVLTQFDSLEQQEKSFKSLQLRSQYVIKEIYNNGLVKNDPEIEKILANNAIISILSGNIVSEKYSRDLIHQDQLSEFISNKFIDLPNSPLKDKWLVFFNRLITPNIEYDKTFTDSYFDNQMNALIPYDGFVSKGTKIISKGDVIEDTEYAKLSSISEEYKTMTWSQNNQTWLIIAYTVLVAVVLLMLLLFINHYRPEIGSDTTKLSFIFLNIILMVLATTLILKYAPKYLYIIPYMILPLVFKAFFDARLGLFSHVMTVLILGFIVPNSFEFIFIQITAGIITVLTVSELNKRANLFLTVAKITGVYLLVYIAMSITYEGGPFGIDHRDVVLFVLNGLITASLIIPLIYIFERIFRLVSDETLREFSDTNHLLLKDLNEKAPGTFQHSVQVANIAEGAAKEIGANILLTRTGALYHDIGKMYNPMYYIENQNTGLNPHLDLDPEESASIIIDHVSLGIELAKKYKLPDRLIDFIRTHHGTNLVYYFYKKEEEYNPNATDINKFRYPGPIPFSKETAIVMISDACEAASKSLNNPTAEVLDQLVEKIVKSQMDNGQFLNANITFKEIQLVKKVVKRKLNNIYHIRIEYPE